MAGETRKITATCSCGKAYRVGADKAGKKFACKACGGTVRVPGSAGPAEPEAPGQGRAPAGRSRPAAGARAPRREGVRGRPRKSGFLGVFVALVLGLVVGAAAGVVAIAATDSPESKTE